MQLTGHRLRHAVVISLATVLLLGTGCKSTGMFRGRWLANYNTAERAQQKTGKTMLVLLEDANPKRNECVKEALDTKRGRQATRHWVRCSLIRDYEPDRRYVAQYEVDRAPALILIEPDGSYRSTIELADSQAIFEFLEDGAAEKENAKPDCFVNRSGAYHWIKNYNNAVEQGELNDKPVLVVFHRSLSRQWSRMRKLLEAPEVYGRLAGMVHCRLPLSRSSNRELMAEVGLGESPAILLIWPDGTYRSLEKPVSAISVARFIDDAERSHVGQASEPDVVSESP